MTIPLELFEQFQPIEYLKGLGGNDHYIGAKYADDLVVFENMRHGNALYVLYGVDSGRGQDRIIRRLQPDISTYIRL